MLYLVRMDVKLPSDMPEQQASELKVREKAYCHELQRSGQWVNIWRVVGEYANFSVFDTQNHDELHQLLSSLPLFPYMSIQVTPLAKHPSAL